MPPIINLSECCVTTMDDEGKRIRCLSADAHSDNITDYLVHFLGCIEIAERFAFLTDKDYKVWTDEVRHHQKKSNKSPEYAEALSATKRDKWRKVARKNSVAFDFFEKPCPRIQKTENWSKMLRGVLKLGESLWNSVRGFRWFKNGEKAGGNPRTRKHNAEMMIKVRN